MYQSITASELLGKKNVKILDVRTPGEHQGGYIKGALLIPLQTLTAQISQLNKNENYYVICHSGARSATACNFLSQNGYQVINVLGGMSAYRGELCYEL